MKFFAQDGNKIAARLILYIAVGENPEKKMELMFMAELDEAGRYLNLWEQATHYLGGEE